jgi:hypothetical protein
LNWFSREKFSLRGQVLQREDVSVVTPAAAATPSRFTGGTSDITYQMAGEKGWGISCHPRCPGKCWKAR